MLDSSPMLAAYRANSARLGREVHDPDPSRRVVGSTDMGNISYLLPSIHPMVKVAPDGVPIHTPAFTEFAITEEADRAVLDAAKAMAMTVVDLWASEGDFVTRTVCGRPVILCRVSAERVVRFRLRSVAAVIALLLAVWALLHVLSVARHVVTWFLIALFLAMAINPLVELLQRRFRVRRAPAVAIAYVLILLVIVGIGFAFVPTLVHQVNEFAKAVPGYIDDLIKGRGRLGFLQTKYHIVATVRHAIRVFTDQLATST